MCIRDRVQTKRHRGRASAKRSESRQAFVIARTHRIQHAVQVTPASALHARQLYHAGCCKAAGCVTARRSCGRAPLIRLRHLLPASGEKEKTNNGKSGGKSVSITFPSPRSRGEDRVRGASEKPS